MKRCCEARCWATNEGLHWGDITVVDEEIIIEEDGEELRIWIHGCQAHQYYYEYVEPPKDCDTIRDDVNETAQAREAILKARLIK